MRGRYLSLLALAAGVFSLSDTGVAVGSNHLRVPNRATPFHRVASGEVSTVAAGGHYVFIVKGTYAPYGPPPQQQFITTGTLINERDGTRTHLVAPNCPGIGRAMFGGPWLMVECASSPDGAPALAVYDLAAHSWQSITLDHTGNPPGGLCAFLLNEEGGCTPVGVGRFWIEFLVTAYHEANSYVLQPIPAGPLDNVAQVTPQQPWAFDLNSANGVQRLCRPLTYPSFSYPTVDGTSREPGWIETLGRFAVVADAFPAGGIEYSHAYLERCGHTTRIKLPGNPGIAATTRDIAWWRPGHVDGIRLPSLRRFSFKTPAGLGRKASTSGSPVVALSNTKVYIASGGTLWSAPVR
jgi:hypothetical protein